MGERGFAYQRTFVLASVRGVCWPGGWQRACRSLHGQKLARRSAQGSRSLMLL